MTSFYEEMQELAGELLTADDDNFGQSKTGNVINILYRTVSSTGATDLDEDTISFPETQVKAVSRGTSEKRDGETLAVKAEKVFTIYAKDVTKPTIADRIEEAGTAYSIVDVQESSNDGTRAVYKVYVSQ